MTTTTTPEDPKGSVQPEPAVAPIAPPGEQPSGGSPDQPSGGGWPKGRTPWLIGGVVLLAVIGLVVWLVWPSSPGLPAHAQPPPLSPNPVTNVGGQALLSTLRAGEAANYHVSFKVVGDPQQLGGTLTLEIWQSPPNTREDTVLVSSGKTTRTESITSASGGHVCTKPPGEKWTCTTISKAQASEGGATGILNAISGQVSGHGVLSKKQTIDGHAVTCFTVQSAEQPELCATAEGVPVLIADKVVSYRLVSFSDTVDPSAFSLPSQN